MDLTTFLGQVNRGALIERGSEAHAFMHGVAREALQLVAETNSGCRMPEEIRACFLDSGVGRLMSQSRYSRRSTASSPDGHGHLAMRRSGVLNPLSSTRLTGH